jgi:putative cardiolipin synthase
MRYRRLLLVLTAFTLAACNAVPDKLPRPAPGYAALPGPDTIFAPMEESIRAHDGPDSSGFMLLGSNEDGLRWRLALIDSAKYSIDVQHYVWFHDAAGRLLASGC